MKGYSGGGIAHKSARFGQGSGPIWLEALDCNGNEKNIKECKKGTPTFSHCSHSEDAGVTCYNSPTYELYLQLLLHHFLYILNRNI